MRRERQVRRLEYLPRDQLITLIRGARALLFPSIYEGFGLPVIEAMALGTPVVTSASRLCRRSRAMRPCSSIPIPSTASPGPFAPSRRTRSSSRMVRAGGSRRRSSRRPFMTSGSRSCTSACSDDYGLAARNVCRLAILRLVEPPDVVAVRTFARRAMLRRLTPPRGDLPPPSLSDRHLRSPKRARPHRRVSAPLSPAGHTALVLRRQRVDRWQHPAPHAAARRRSLRNRRAVRVATQARLDHSSHRRSWPGPLVSAGRRR